MAKHASSFIVLAAVLLMGCGDGGGGASPNNKAVPVIGTQPAGLTVQETQTATFTVTGSGSGSGALTYQWRKNGADITGATASSYTTPVKLSDNGSQYAVVVTVTSAAATLTVRAGPSAQPAVASGPAAAPVANASAGVLNETRIIVGASTALSQESSAITRFLAAQCGCQVNFIRTTALGSSVYQLDLPSSVTPDRFIQKAQAEGRALGITYVEIDARVFINQPGGIKQ